MFGGSLVHLTPRLQKNNQTKHVIQHGGAEEARACKETLAECTEQGLRLLAPFMPFIAEELWQRLVGATSSTGRAIAESITMAPFPEPVPGRRDAVLEQQVAELQRIVASLRACPVVLNHKGPRDTLPRVLLVPAPGRDRAVYDQNTLFLKSQTRLPAVAVAEAGTGCLPSDYISTPSASAACEIYIQALGLVDARAAEAELQRLAARRVKVEKQLSKLAQGMESAHYVAQAAPEAQQRDHEKKRSLESMVQEIESAAGVYTQIRRLHERAQ